MGLVIGITPFAVGVWLLLHNGWLGLAALVVQPRSGELELSRPGVPELIL